MQYIFWCEYEVFVMLKSIQAIGFNINSLPQTVYAFTRGYSKCFRVQAFDISKCLDNVYFMLLGFAQFYQYNVRYIVKSNYFN